MPCSFRMALHKGPVVRTTQRYQTSSPRCGLRSSWFPTATQELPSGGWEAACWGPPFSFLFSVSLTLETLSSGYRDSGGLSTVSFGFLILYCLKGYMLGNSNCTTVQNFSVMLTLNLIFPQNIYICQESSDINSLKELFKSGIRLEGDTRQEEVVTSSPDLLRLNSLWHRNFPLCCLSLRSCSASRVRRNVKQWRTKGIFNCQLFIEPTPPKPLPPNPKHYLPWLERNSELCL